MHEYKLDNPALTVIIQILCAESFVHFSHWEGGCELHDIVCGHMQAQYNKKKVVRP